jgi:hypothetical protein
MNIKEIKKEMQFKSENDEIYLATNLIYSSNINVSDV